MPAYNAEQTLTQTYHDLPMDIVDEVVLVDDASHDDTVALAAELGIRHIVIGHRKMTHSGQNY